MDVPVILEFRLDGLGLEFTRDTFLLQGDTGYASAELGSFD
jgi:hypothetical protein